jgi:AcrR family transcriptional regulator
LDPDERQHSNRRDRGEIGNDVGMPLETATSKRRLGGDRKVFRRRREILDTAARIFYEKGYNATSTKDIADAVGLLKGSLYYYIESKEDFLYEMIRDSHDGALATLERVRQFEGDVLQRLAYFVSQHIGYFVANLATTTVYFREFNVLSDERKRVIAAEGDAYLDFLRNLLLEGQREGVIAAELDVRLVSIGLVGMLNSMWLWYQPDGVRSTEEIAAEFVKVIVAGVASDGAIQAMGSVSNLRRYVAPRVVHTPGKRKKTVKVARSTMANKEVAARHAARPPKPGGG